VVHPQVLQQGVQTLLDDSATQRLACRIVLKLQHGAHILLDRQFPKNRGFLGQVTQTQPCTPMNGHVFNRITVNRYFASVRAHQAHNHVKRSGFTGTVGAQQTHHLTALDRQRNVLHDLAAAVGLLQAGGYQAAGACWQGDASGDQHYRRCSSRPGGAKRKT